MTDSEKHISIALRVFAFSLMLNGVMVFISTCVQIAGNLPILGAVVFFSISLLAIISGAFALKNSMRALIVGLLFYATQVVRFKSESFSFALRASFRADITFPSQDYVLVINLLALGLLALGIFVLHKRLTHPSTRTPR